MRLLDSTSLELKEFRANRVPEYAILSHTWGNDADEVIFADMQAGTANHRAAYGKLWHCCEQARKEDIQWVWIDTCCIDKSSSAELSESINSMYAWYNQAKVCYAYLADVPTNANLRSNIFSGSRWFTRGWTLQELIAPTDLIFYSSDWDQIGTRAALKEILADITGIDASILTGEKKLDSTSIAKRMSWASRRETSRLEDTAYSLMGLFNVNMPMLYGEGEKAFIRLQEEIMKHSDDQSIFAWVDPKAPEEVGVGLLAKSPAKFIDSGHYLPYRDWEARKPYSISNKGLSIDMHLTPWKDDIYTAALDCPAPPEYEGFLGIYLKRLLTGDQQYARVKSRNLCKMVARGSIETVYVRQTPVVSGNQDVYPQHIFQLRKGPKQADGYKLTKTLRSPKSQGSPGFITSSLGRDWMPAGMPFTFKIAKGTGELAAVLLLQREDGEMLIIMLGSTPDFGVAFDAIATSYIEEFEQLQGVFNPHAPGNTIGLEYHQVRVDTQPRIHEGSKYYMVDINVDPIWHTPNPLEVIASLLPVQLQDNRPSAKPDPARGLRKLFGNRR